MTPTKSTTDRPAAPRVVYRPPAAGREGSGGQPVDPRIAKRRESVQRTRSRRRLRWCIAAVVVVGLLVGAWFLLHSSVFAARVVTVSGVSGARQAQVLAASGLDRHPALIGVSPGAAEQAIERLPWVRTATVSRHWPDGVSVAVGVRQPAAQLFRPGGWAVVDRSGRVLADQAAQDPAVPVVRVVGAPGPPGTWVPPRMRPGVAVAATLPPAFRAQVTEVVVDPGGQVELQLTSPLTVDLGTATQLHQKYQDVAALLAGTTFQAGQVIDVTVPSSPLVSGP